MISKKKMRTVAVGVVTIATVLVAAGAASAVTQTNGSAGALYVYDTNSASTTNSTVFGWSDDAIASSSSANASGVFTCNTNSTGSFAFLTAATKSATAPSTWDASKSLGSRVSNKDLASVNLAPSSLNLGAPAGVKSAGGSYYLGVACTSNNGLTVEAAYYRTVSVTAGSGAYSTTDTPVTNAFRVTTQPVSQTVAAGSNVTFTAAFGGTDPAAGTNIKWQKAEATANTVFTDVAGATTGTLVVSAVTIADDSGDKYQALVSNDNGSTFITSDVATLTVSSTTGSVGLNATVVDAQDGTLSLAVPSSASVTFGSAVLVANKSTSTGSLPNITVNDARVHTRPGWNLTASVTDFSYLTNSISKTQLGLVPAVVSATAVATTAGVTQTAGTASYPAVIATGAANNTVGNTVLNGALTFVAPQEKPAGTYTSTMTLTLVSK